MKISNNLRFFLEKPEESDSYIRVSLDSQDISLKLTACEKNIWWYFPVGSRKDLRRAKRKIDKLKGFVDALYQYIHSLPEPERKE